MTNRRVWIRRGLLGTLAVLAGQQTWRHGRDYLFADKFAVVEPGKIYRGAWQQPWPMRRLVSRYQIKTVVALAHPPTHPLAVREKALAATIGVRWVHIPIVDQRLIGELATINDQLDEAAAMVANPKNQPVYFHCHHGINRTSMVQIAYRTKYCGWSLEQATDEIARTFGLVEANHGPDYRLLETYYHERVLPYRAAQAAARADRTRVTAALRAPPPRPGSELLDPTRRPSRARDSPATGPFSGGGFAAMLKESRRDHRLEHILRCASIRVRRHWPWSRSRN